VAFLCAFLTRLYPYQLLVDDFAANGFKTVMLDMFDGDPVPSNVFEQPVRPSSLLLVGFSTTFLDSVRLAALGSASSA
jgi:hypothetical protein